MSYSGWDSTRFHAAMGSQYSYPLTISCWIKKTDSEWNTGADYAWTFNYDSNSDNNGIRVYTINDEVVCCNIETGSQDCVSNSFTAGKYNDKWVPVIVVYKSATSKRIYIENSSYGSADDVTDRDLTLLDEFRVGRIMVGVGAFQGKIAEIAIWDKELSPAEIDLINPGDSVSETGPPATEIASANLVAYWPLNYDSTTQVDESGNGESSLVEGGSGGPLDYETDHPTIQSSTLVKSVERVTIDWDATSEPVTQNLSKSQNYARCVPFFTKRLVSGSLADDWRERTMKVEMISNAGTPAVRVSAAGKTDADDHRIECYVVEFETNITVQQVDADISDTSTSANITITDVGTQASAFFLYSYQYTHGSAQDRADYACVRPVWNGASTTSVTIERTGSTGTIDGMLYVISCDNSEFSVQHRDISIAATDETTNDTITASPMGTTFLVTHFRSSEVEDDPLDWSFVANLTSTTNVRVRRSIAGASNAAANVGVQVVTALGGQWSVLRGDFTTTSNLTETTTISAVDLNRAIVKTGTHEAGLNSLGTSDLAAGTIIDEVGPAAYLSSNNQITWVRESVSETGNTIPYEVIQFKAGLDNSILIPTGPLR
jgi:hypothetical protein